MAFLAVAVVLGAAAIVIFALASWEADAQAPFVLGWFGLCIAIAFAVIWAADALVRAALHRLRR